MTEILRLAGDDLIVSAACAKAMVIAGTFVEVRLDKLLELCAEVEALRNSQKSPPQSGVDCKVLLDSPVQPEPAAAPVQPDPPAAPAKPASPVQPATPAKPEPPAAPPYLGHDRAKDGDIKTAELSQRMLGLVGKVNTYDPRATASPIDSILVVVCRAVLTNLDAAGIARDTSIQLSAVGAVLQRRKELIARGRSLATKEEQREFLRIFGMLLRNDKSSQAEIARIREGAKP